MAKDDRIELKKIDEAIQDVTRKLRAARYGAGATHRVHIDTLAQQLGALSTQTKKICVRTYGVWPPEETPVKKPVPGKPKPKPQPKRKPSRPKKSS